MGWTDRDKIYVHDDGTPYVYVFAVQDLPAGYICVADDDRNAILLTGNASDFDRLGQAMVTIRKGEYGWLDISMPLMPPISLPVPDVH